MTDKKKKYVRHNPVYRKVDKDDPETQLRKCLAHECGEAFLSTWKGNRICPRCTTILNNLGSSSELTEYDVTRSKGRSGNIRD